MTPLVGQGNVPVAAAFAGSPQRESSNLRVYRSRFGYDTPADDELAETIRSRQAGVIVIEECEFAHRRGYRDVLDLERFNSYRAWARTTSDGKLSQHRNLQAQAYLDKFVKEHYQY